LVIFANSVMTDMHKPYMLRCIELARSGAGFVAPNPMVGAVLVHEGRIIGEGWHKQYGQAHAEVNCIDSVAEQDRQLIEASTIYVSLEPCAHFGKTPPCSDLIIKMKIPKVVIGCRDPFEAVNGKGIEKLQKAGVEVITGVMEEACMALNKRFFTFHNQYRPYIILKWAQTANGKIAAASDERLLISNECTNRLVHQWRSEEAAILVGTNTALKDNPSLNNRSGKGKQPVRLVLDMNLRLPDSLKIFDQQQKTILFTAGKREDKENISYQPIDAGKNIIQQILDVCYQLNLQSILVEGGAQLLQSFIDQGIWDEVRIITNTVLSIPEGLDAPLFLLKPVNIEKLHTDHIHYYTNNLKTTPNSKLQTPNS
jgi:diaminohydroxyphosphoribosylaminopyrimidine deaminase/5-amino-6-(5-phosphoribosylamino)uracil reductase